MSQDTLPPSLIAGQAWGNGAAGQEGHDLAPGLTKTQKEDHRAWL